MIDRKNASPICDLLQLAPAVVVMLAFLKKANAKQAAESPAEREAREQRKRAREESELLAERNRKYDSIQRIGSTNFKQGVSGQPKKFGQHVLGGNMFRRVAGALFFSYEDLDPELLYTEMTDDSERLVGKTAGLSRLFGNKSLHDLAAESTKAEAAIARAALLGKFHQTLFGPAGMETKKAGAKKPRFKWAPETKQLAVDKVRELMNKSKTTLVGGGFLYANVDTLLAPALKALVASSP